MTRESARLIHDALSAANIATAGEVALDFWGIEAVTPSFVDEVLAVIENTLRDTERSKVRIHFLNSPTRLSAKFSAVARARGVQISESENGSWTITAGSS